MGDACRGCVSDQNNPFPSARTLRPSNSLTTHKRTRTHTHAHCAPTHTRKNACSLSVEVVAAAASDVIATTLPTGWVATVDPSSGKTYYAHMESGRTSWEVPTEEPPAPEPAAGGGGDGVGASAAQTAAAVSEKAAAEREAIATRLEVAADAWERDNAPATARLMNLATVIRAGNFER